MRYGSLAIAVLCGLALAGCSAGKEVRYTPGEIKNFAPDVQERIRVGELALTMTQAQVRLAWGAPQAVRTITTDDGSVREEWEYRSMFGAVRTYLYFEDGILTRLVTGKPGILMPESAPAKSGATDKQKEDAAPR